MQRSLPFWWKMIPFLVLGSLFLLSGCDFQSRQSTFDPKGPVAKEQLDLFMVTVWVVLFLFLAVGGALLYAVIRFRERKTDSPDFHPPQTHGNPLVELGLIGVSILMLAIIAVPTIQAIWFTHYPPDDEASKLGKWFGKDLSEQAQDETLLVQVYGWQWWWSFEYPQLGITTANELVIPVGKVVRLELRSRDVIHSFWLPKLAGKVDTIPGRLNHMWIQADEPGHYYGQCAEFCGEAHAYMLFRADALEPEEFKNWVSHQKQPAKPVGANTWEDFRGKMTAVRSGEQPFAGDDLAEGAALFYDKGRCNTCHAVGGSGLALGIVAPDLTHLASRSSLGAGWMDHRDAEGAIDEAKQLQNFYDWVRQSEKIKPGNLMHHGTAGMAGLKDIPLTDEEVRKIALYLQTLK
jgi:cytochrome c oxidase subunit II